MFGDILKVVGILGAAAVVLGIQHEGQKSKSPVEQYRKQMESPKFVESPHLDSALRKAESGNASKMTREELDAFVEWREECARKGRHWARESR